MVHSTSNWMNEWMNNGFNRRNQGIYNNTTRLCLQLTEPPLLKDTSDEQVLAYVESPLSMAYPNNSQFIERMIEEITKKGVKAVDPKIRDGMVKDTLGSRQKMPRCQTKADYRRL